MRLKGKTAIITGGNSGVGESTAKLFAKEGARIVISARRKEQLEQVALSIREQGGEVLPVVCDISQPLEVKSLVEHTIRVYGQIDILVNNAGVLEEGLKPVDRVLDEDLDKVIAINEKGTIYCLREVTNYMSKAKSGSIINVASVAGVMGCGGAAYVASKAAINGITRHTALRFAGTGIRCNAVCPGNIITPMTMNTIPEALDTDMFAAMAKHSDLRVQSCMPEDVANIILFLASDESRAITGQCIVSDFGSTL